MSGLTLVPNEVVGYRVRPDFYSWKVVLVKRHGAGSRQAGQTYDTPVEYYRSFEGAIQGIYNLEARLRTQAAQDALEAATGEVASHAVLLEAFEGAGRAALEAARAFEAEMKAAGVSLHDIARAMRVNPDAGQDGSSDSEAA